MRHFEPVQGSAVKLAPTLDEFSTDGGGGTLGRRPAARNLLQSLNDRSVCRVPKTPGLRRAGESRRD